MQVGLTAVLRPVVLNMLDRDVVLRAFPSLAVALFAQNLLRPELSGVVHPTCHGVGAVRLFSFQVNEALVALLIGRSDAGQLCLLLHSAPFSEPLQILQLLFRLATVVHKRRILTDVQV